MAIRSVLLKANRLTSFTCAFVGAVAIGSALPAYAVKPSATELAITKEWAAANLFSEEQNAWEFMYNRGGSFGIMKGWPKERSEEQLDENTKQTIFVATDPSTQLEVRLEVTEYADYPAVEWVLRFTNKGQDDTPILQNVLPLSTSFANSKPGDPFRIRYALGSHERSDDFRMTETQTVSAPEVLTLAPFGGRSSDGTLPFFNLLKSSGGVCLGVGWSGQWQTTFRHAEDQSMNVRAGMEFTHFKLRPGESVRTPAILLVFWEGNDPLRGHNLLRATLRDHFTPRPGGKQVDVPVSMSAHGTYGFESTTAADMVSFIENFTAHDAGFDNFWIDTGWFELIDNNWARSVGNPDPDKTRYPDGLKPVGEAAHACGVNFLLWFEPERVMPDTWLMKHHKSWVIPPPANLPFELSYMYFDGFHLLDLGNPRARQWVIEKLIAQIKEFGVDTYRQDFNMYPLAYWRSGERPDRQGIREMHYVEGLYQVWDALQAQYPDLLIDNCASGGRRIDFETLRRAIPFFRSDVVYRSAMANQCQEYALSMWIPYHGVGTISIDPYQFRSGLGAVFSSAFNINNSDADWHALGEMIKQYRQYRDAYLGDFYPLTPYTLSNATDIAWQFHREDLESGVVQAFRREGSEAGSVTLKLQGLTSDQSYRVTNVDNPGDATVMTGERLMTDGLTIPLPAVPYAGLVRYAIADAAGGGTASVPVNQQQ
jgi:alpha-galactosidase